jgi:hypothetical protein
MVENKYDAAFNAIVFYGIKVSMKVNYFFMVQALIFHSIFVASQSLSADRQDFICIAYGIRKGTLSKLILHGFMNTHSEVYK